MTPRATSLLPVLLAILLVPGAASSASAAYAPAESAAVARAEWAAMRKARSAGDREAAVAHAARAHAAWPGQWVYAYGLASVAATAGDATAVQRGLADLASLGAGPDLTPDTTLVIYARTHAPQEFARVVANAKPAATSAVAFRFPPAESTFWAEGLAVDRKGGGFLLTDVRRGRVAAVSAGIMKDFARVEPRGGWSALAIAVDDSRGLVWVTAAALPQAEGFVPADSGRAAILAFDRSTGALRERHDLPPASDGHVPGDLQVTREGEVYVSDSSHPVIYRVRAGQLEEFATDPGFRSLQGQAMTPDGRTLFVADYSHGIAAVDRATRAVRWLDGSPLGIDGLAWINGGLVAVQNGILPPRVLRITLGGPKASDSFGRWDSRIWSVHEVDRNLALADEPTLVVGSRGGFAVYIANSQWEKYDDQGVRRPGTTLTAPIGLRIPDRLLLRDSPMEGPVREPIPQLRGVR